MNVSVGTVEVDSGEWRGKISLDDGDDSAVLQCSHQHLTKKEAKKCAKSTVSRMGLE